MAQLWLGFAVDRVRPHWCRHQRVFTTRRQLPRPAVCKEQHASLRVLGRDNSNGGSRQQQRRHQRDKSNGGPPAKFRHLAAAGRGAQHQLWRLPRASRLRPGRRLPGQQPARGMVRAIRGRRSAPVDARHLH
eukprot:4389028-Prymnesium_polylepis.1